MFTAHADRSAIDVAGVRDCEDDCSDEGARFTRRQAPRRTDPMSGNVTVRPPGRAGAASRRNGERHAACSTRANRPSPCPCSTCREICRPRPPLSRASYPYFPQILQEAACRDRCVFLDAPSLPSARRCRSGHVWRPCPWHDGRTEASCSVGEPGLSQARKPTGIDPATGKNGNYPLHV